MTADLTLLFTNQIGCVCLWLGNGGERVTETFITEKKHIYDITDIVKKRRKYWGNITIVLFLFRFSFVVLFLLPLVSICDREEKLGLAPC